jgi:hypothetical protein
MDGKQTDKVDVFHCPQIQHKPLKIQYAKKVLFQTETEDVSHLIFQPNAQLATWVTETETASKCHHQCPPPQHQLQVLAHAKVQLMNYNQKSQFCKPPLLINHSHLLNHKQPGENQIQHQVETQIFKSKLMSMPRNFFNLRVRIKMLTKTRTKRWSEINIIYWNHIEICLGNTRKNLLLIYLL